MLHVWRIAGADGVWIPASGDCAGGISSTSGGAAPYRIGKRCTTATDIDWAQVGGWAALIGGGLILTFRIVCTVVSGGVCAPVAGLGAVALEFGSGLALAGGGVTAATTVSISTGAAAIGAAGLGIGAGGANILNNTAHDSGADSGVPADSNPGIKIGPKIENQMEKRGWTQESIDDLISNPTRTVATRDSRYLPDGAGRNDSPATAYINRMGGYVVRNDETGDIVQVSNLKDPNWKSPW